MTTIYVSKQSLKSTIEYFSESNYNLPVQLGLFFFFKSIGVTDRDYTDFQKVKFLDSQLKELYMQNLYQLSGMFTLKEDGERRSSLFPFAINSSIKNKDFFNGGSNFKNLLSRMRDTIDNTLIDKFLDRNNDERIKFKRDYLNFIKVNFLENQKISLIHMSKWVCRFLSFDVSAFSNFTDEDFTRLCKKKTIEFLNLSDNELQELFHDDSYKQNISYSKHMITGSNFRKLFSFKDSPNILSQPNTLNLKDSLITQNEVCKFMETNENNPSTQEIINLLKLQKQIVLYGVPGVGKSNFISKIEDQYNPKNIIKIQFHPNTTYEEFIGGETIENGTIVTKSGKFLEACEKAKNDTSEKYLFVIDEINRGNISKIFGETIQVLDREYEVDLMKPIKVNGKQISKISIPENMDIVATMNSTDRSIAVLDFAIRRRFSFVKLYPNYEIVSELSNTDYINIQPSLLFKSINNKIYETLKDEELLLGQSYFLPSFAKKENNKIKWNISYLRYIFNYSIIPTLEEYTFGNKNDLLNIVGEKLLNRISDDDDFNNAIIEKYPECEKI